MPSVSPLAHSLEHLSRELLHQLAEAHFDRARLLRLAERVGTFNNRVDGKVTEPAPEDIRALPEGPERDVLTQAGAAALRRGEVASVLLAGGMATRMGGLVKALLPVIDRPDLSRCSPARNGRCRAQIRPGRSPLGHGELRHSGRASRRPRRARAHDRCPAQPPGCGLVRARRFVAPQPRRNALPGRQRRAEPLRNGTRRPHDALIRSGLLHRFVEAGGKTLWIANIDNLGAGVDPALLGLHLAHGAALSVELVDEVGTDRGGIPVRWNERPVVLEEFRLPLGFDPQAVRVFNTNTFLVNAKALLNLQMDWTFFEVRKRVGTNDVIQFERLLGELTSALPTKFLRVPREGVHSRFLPVKDNDSSPRERRKFASLRWRVGSSKGLISEPIEEQAAPPRFPDLASEEARHPSLEIATVSDEARSSFLRNRNRLRRSQVPFLRNRNRLRRAPGIPPTKSRYVSEGPASFLEIAIVSEGPGILLRNRDRLGRAPESFPEIAIVSEGPRHPSYEIAIVSEGPGTLSFEIAIVSEAPGTLLGMAIVFQRAPASFLRNRNRLRRAPASFLRNRNGLRRAPAPLPHTRDCLQRAPARHGAVPWRREQIAGGQNGHAPSR